MRIVVRFLLVTVIVAALSTRCGWVRDADAAVSIPLRDVPGLSEEARQAEGQLWQAVGPVCWFPKSKTGLFELRLNDAARFPVSDIVFLHTDAEGLGHLARELKFVREQSARVGVASISQAASGAGEATKAMANGLLDVFKHPIDTVKAMYGGVSGLVDYAKLVAEGRAQPSADVAFFVDGYWLNVCTQVSGEFGCNYLEMQTPEARALVETLARPRIVGRATAELLAAFAPVALMRVARALEVSGEVARVACEWRSAQRVAQCAEAFSEGARVRRALLRGQRFAKLAESGTRMEKIVGSLIDPARLATITTRSGVTTRTHKLLAYLYQHEAAGGDIAGVLKKAAGRDSGIFDAKIDIAQIQKTYHQAKEWGIFDDAGNIERMQHERAPTITRGPYAGQFVEVDHIIPWSRAPETRTTFGNLRYLPEKVNQARSDTLDADMIEKVNEYAKRGLLTPGRAKELLPPNQA